MSGIRSAKYRLRAFGGLSIDIYDHSTKAPATQRKALALLALLASAGERGISRDKITAFLWPESDKEQARNALSQLLFRVRREFGADAVQGEGTLRLNAGLVGSDVAEFDAAVASGALERACGIYGGRFLDGFHLSGAPEFQFWIDQNATRLENQFHVALETLGQRAADTGDGQRAVYWWRRRADAEPLSARVARSYMEALVVNGDREAALRFATAHCTLVRQELDSEPDPEVLRLVDRIRKSDWRGPPSPVRVLPAPSVEWTTELSDRIPRSLPDHTADVSGLDETVEPQTAVAAAVAEPIIARTAPRLRTKGLIYAAVAAIVIVGGFIAIKRATTRPTEHVAAVVPFASAGDTSLDVVGQMLAASVSRTLAQSGHVRVIDVSDGADAESGRAGGSRSPADLVRSARDAGATLIVQGSIRRVAGDLVVLTSLTQNGRERTVRTLAPIASSGREGAMEDLRMAVAGAVVAVVNPRTSELARATELPRYDAYVHYLDAVEHEVRGNRRDALASFRKAAVIDTMFAGAPLMLLELAPAPVFDSLAEVLDARRARLSERDQLVLEALRARKRGDLEAYFDFARRIVELVPDEPLALYRLAHAAVQTNRYEAALRAVHRMRGNPAWPNDNFSTWQLDLQAHHLLGDDDTAIREWKRVQALYPNELVVCTWGVRQYAAFGYAEEVDSLIARCPTPVGAPHDLRRLGRRIEVQDELYRWAGREALWHGHVTDGRRMLRRAYNFERDLFAQDSAANNGWLAADLSGDWAKAYELMNASFPAGLTPEPPCRRPDPRGVCARPYRVRYAVSAARVGDTLTALRVLAEIDALPHADSSYKVERAKILLALGRRDEAIRSLRDAARFVSADAWHAHTHLLELRGDKWVEMLIAPRR